MDLFVTTASESSPDWVPVSACTLPMVEQSLRMAEFDDLFATTLRGVEWAGPGGSAVQLLLAGDRSLPERVQRLADAESSCCSFFTFTVSTADEPHGAVSVALGIEVPSVYVDVLAALVARAVATVPSTP
jgi:hypothetical protein